MASSEFWRDLAGQFQRLHETYGALRYHWLNDGAVWKFAGSASGSIRRSFEALAIRGASKIASADATDLLIAWLEALRIEGYGLQSGETGSIYDVCEASANFCRMLESDALQAEFGEKYPSDPQPVPSPPPEETIAAQLRSLLKESRWTAEELAEAVGINTRTVTRHLSGETVPYPRNISAYERVFSNQLKRQVVINKMP
jgi:hypothetical protein